MHPTFAKIMFAATVGGLWLTSCAPQPTSETPSSAPATEVKSREPATVEATPKPAIERSETGSPQVDHPKAWAHAHSDHDSKHGGTFFMALDNKHHLEGVLLPPGVFRIFVYDEYTRPLNAASLAKIRGKVIWGDSDGSPEVSLQEALHGSALEAKAPGTMRFPVVLTLLLHFPGMAASAKAELFTFPFSHYTPHPE